MEILVNSINTRQSTLCSCPRFVFASKAKLPSPSQKEITPSPTRSRPTPRSPCSPRLSLGTTADLEMTLRWSTDIRKPYAPPPKLLQWLNRQDHQNKPSHHNGKKGKCTDVTGAQRLWNALGYSCKRTLSPYGQCAPRPDSLLRKCWSLATVSLTSASHDVFSPLVSWHIWRGQWGPWYPYWLLSFPNLILACRKLESQQLSFK